MTLRLLLVLPLATLSIATASARERAPQVEDAGRELANDPYHADRRLTKGRLEGFRKLFVDPDDFAASLTPVEPPAMDAPKVELPPAPAVDPAAAPAEGAPAEGAVGEIGTAATEVPVPRPTVPAPPPRGDLRVYNATSSWADLSINGQKVAIIGPFDHAIVRDVKSGGYDVTYTLTNGFTYTERVNTVPPQ